MVSAYLRGQSRRRRRVRIRSKPSNHTGGKFAQTRVGAGRRDANIAASKVRKWVRACAIAERSPTLHYSSNASTRAELAEPVASVSRRSLSIDVLRGLAALLVLAFHAQTVHGLAEMFATPTQVEIAVASVVVLGQAGVVLFFCISGYLIAGPFIRALASQRELPDSTPAMPGAGWRASRRPTGLRSRGQSSSVGCLRGWRW